MLSPYAKNEWLTILAIGLLLTIASFAVGLWWLAFLILPLTAALIAFFRDPNRKIPSQRGAMISPADGRVSSIHEVEHFEPFDSPATCIRIFLSVLDVHINRSPCHGQVKSITYKPGDHKNALNPTSAETNESNLIVLVHPIRQHPLAAVRQVAGLLARTITCGVSEGDVAQRGQRIGIIKLGSTTELYLPAELQPKVVVQQGQSVYAGMTVLATVMSKDAIETGPASTPANPSADEPAAAQATEPAQSTSA